MTKTGVLIINTGTPDAPTEDAIRAFLAEMLSDPVLINVPPIIWKRVLKHAILPKRPAKTKPAYESIWTPEGSRFMLASVAQRNLLQAELGSNFLVVLAMRYGNPSITSGLDTLREAGCEEVVIVPLYPQYVRVCAGTCLEETHRCLKEQMAKGWNPTVIEVRDFYQQPAYIQALADSIRETWQPARDGITAAQKLIFSWHSTPMADIEAGDPYRDQNEQTAAAVARELGLADESWMISYQSRFDNRKWLGPFTSDCLGDLARLGVKDVAIICPGFVADNIETLVEVSRTLRDEFLGAAGDGATFTYVHAHNDNPALAKAVAAAIRQALG